MFELWLVAGGGGSYILYTTKQLKGFRKILGFIYNNLVMIIMFSPDKVARQLSFKAIVRPTVWKGGRIMRKRWVF